MYIIGLTGSIGMGKSFVASEFLRCGVPVFDADKAVHGLLAARGKAVNAVGKLFPQAVTAGGIDRNVVAREVFGDKHKLLALEAVLHPLVFEAQRQFITKARRKGLRLVVLEVPLLFEKQVNALCDATMVVTSSLLLQHRRVLSRPGMTETKLRAILATQMHDSKKRQKANFIIYTGLGKAHTRRVINQIVRHGSCQKG